MIYKHNGHDVVLIDVEQAKKLGVKIIETDTIWAMVNAKEVSSDIETFEADGYPLEGEEIVYDFALSEDGHFLETFFAADWVKMSAVYYEYDYDPDTGKPHRGSELDQLMDDIFGLVSEKNADGLEEIRKEYDDEMYRKCKEAGAEFDACVNFNKAFEEAIGDSFENWKIYYSL